MKNKGVGRPRNSYKYSNPETGEFMNAIEYHKLTKNKKLTNKIKRSKQLNEKSERMIDILLEVRTFVNTLIKRELN